MSEHPPSGSSPAAPAASLVGEVLDRRYRIITKIGEGGMGEVYAAEHIHLGKRRAIKLLRPEIVSNKEAVNRFYQEARSASSIGHKNIISIEDFGELPDGRIFMAMELLNGAPLNDMIKQPMPVDRLINILIQTGHGLAAAHAKGITHRDMKPENIYVTVGDNHEDIPKLLDFGIAKVAGNDGQNNLTKTGTIFGTPFYMAPEQALGQQVDARADVYAMGVIMYEVFSGSLPFQGESFMGILTQHITTEPEPVVQRAAAAGRALPPGIPEIISRCMQKDPNRRFATMDALVQALVDVYRAIAGAGMSSYMEAFVAPRGGGPGSATPRTGPYGAPHPGASQPTVIGPGGTGPMPPMHGHGSAPHPSAHTPSGHLGQVAGTPGSGLYPAGGSGLVDVTPKKSKAGLVFAIIAVLAVAGGVAVFIVLGNKDKGEPGAGTGSAGTGSAIASGTGGGTGGGTAVGGTTIDAGGTVAGTTVDAAAAPTTTPDAAAVETAADARPAAPEAALVIIDSKNVSKFEVWENGKKLGTGATPIKVTPGTPRTFVLKSKGYKDESVTVDGKVAKVEVRLEKEKGSGPTPPQTLDCSDRVKDPKNQKCVDQYCAKHPADSKYCLE